MKLKTQKCRTVLPVIVILMVTFTRVASGAAESVQDTAFGKAARSATVGDAYAQGSADGQKWVVGTRAWEMVLERRMGRVRLVSYKNKLTEPAHEYVAADSGTGVFFLQAGTENTSPSPDTDWIQGKSAVRTVMAGGRPAVQLDLRFTCETLEVELHVVVFPGTAVLQQWVELRNTGSQPVAIKGFVPFGVQLPGGEADSFHQYWMIGANNKASAGMMLSAPVGPDYHRELTGPATERLCISWTGMRRITPPYDGWFLEVESISNWRLVVDRKGSGSATVTAVIPDLVNWTLAPGDHVMGPVMTLGVFRDDFDDMGERVYLWQYEYLWDYTSDEWYAKMPGGPGYYNDVQNLQENFAGRLAKLNMDWTEVARSIGLEVVWDDAGWSESPNVWTPSREGPDFAQTLRFLPKMDMKWLVWFCAWPTAGLMDTKVGAWGNFQWRTDGIGFYNHAEHQAFWSQVEKFRRDHPRCSFHTCCGGSTYAHTFGMQRFAEINMLTDPGGGDQTNYYFSYLETPDKWIDVMPFWYTKGKYLPDTSRQMLTMVPSWGLSPAPEDQEQVRRMVEIYRYWLQQGVAGRWTYLHHPSVQSFQGWDTEYYYNQRNSYDRTRACIILKDRAPGDVVIFPRKLLPEHNYVVGFDSTTQTTTRTGADLMANGITIKNQSPGELIYLGLPNRPRSGGDKTAPTAPGRVLTRREVNIGHSGVGIYWSPGTDDNWISYYEVRRGADILGKVSLGTYYFDRADGWNPSVDYAVRTVDGDGNVSDWTTAQSLANEPLTAAALGGNFSLRGREGWQAEITHDGNTFLPMQWVSPAKTPMGDEGGTANQRGGTEGYWEAAGTARVGRGWQQASTEAACVRTWVAPQAGTVRIIGRAMKEYYRHKEGDALRVRILQGDRPIWPQQDWAVVRINDLVGCTHDVSLNVASGDAIRFVLDRGRLPEKDIIAWMPRFIYASEESRGEAASVVRIRCGAEQAFTDHVGNEWSADRFFTGGGPIITTVGVEGALPHTDDQALYQAGRRGRDFTYAIPVVVGLYTVRLKFAEPQYEWFFERPFNLDINGREVLHNFDICQAARRPHRAYERVFRYLVPNEQGQLVLHFTGGWDPLQKSDEAVVQAIEVVPEIRSALRIDVGADAPFVDWNSFIWSSDTDFQGGTVLVSEAAVSQASPTLYDQKLYQTARSGRSVSYKLPISPGLYIVHLKFAELWLKEPGQRPMNIEINGQLRWQGWDPATATGQMGMAADLRTEDIAPDKDGYISAVSS
jgi:hypothetical protein